MLIAAATAPSPFWYATRGTGTVATLLLTLSVALGIANVRRGGVGGLPRFAVSLIHRNVALLALAFLVLHVVTTLLDGFAPISVLDSFLPLKSTYRPVWLGLGVVAFDLMLAIVATSLLRIRLGHRAWRATHWLSYASWPLAIVHGLGTGTDAKAHWMLLLTAACVLLVAAAILVRVSAGWPAHLGARVSAVGLTALFPIGLVAWLPGGPLGADWARRAGTPAYLLSHRSASSTPASAVSASGSFSAPVQGRVRQVQLPNGTTLVDLSLTVSGERLSNLHIRIRGDAIPGGGVQMQSSRVTFGPIDNPDQYSGRVTALQGTDTQADVNGPVGSAYALLASLQIPPGSDAATGTLQASAQTGAR